MQCFVALGGNEGDPASHIQEAARLLAQQVVGFSLSPLFLTTPVSSIPQPNFLNAVCSFECHLSPFSLLSLMRDIERRLGKKPKRREAPRPIDLDLLFYGEEVIFERELVVPHPRWHERLFVIAPLAELTKTLPFGIDVGALLSRFPNRNGERVVRYEESESL